MLRKGLQAIGGKTESWAQPAELGGGRTGSSIKNFPRGSNIALVAYMWGCMIPISRCEGASINTIIIGMESALISGAGKGEAMTQPARRGILPGGFDIRGIEGMIKAATYARENKVPYLGLCLACRLW
jgi:hypothetical protein